MKTNERVVKHMNLSDPELAVFRTHICEQHRNGSCRNADKCPHSHCQTWQRRNPFEYSYSSKLCPEIEFLKKGSKMTLVRRCSRGRGCSFAHSKEEELYHPDMYKTKLCNSHPHCARFFCPFAHVAQEVRKPVLGRTLQVSQGLSEGVENGVPESQHVKCPNSPTSSSTTASSVLSGASPIVTFSIQKKILFEGLVKNHVDTEPKAIDNPKELNVDFTPYGNEALLCSSDSPNKLHEGSSSSPLSRCRKDGAAVVGLSCSKSDDINSNHQRSPKTEVKRASVTQAATRYTTSRLSNIQNNTKDNGGVASLRFAAMNPRIGSSDESLLNTPNNFGASSLSSGSSNNGELPHMSFNGSVAGYVTQHPGLLPPGLSTTVGSQNVFSDIHESYQGSEYRSNWLDRRYDGPSRFVLPPLDISEDYQNSRTRQDDCSPSSNTFYQDHPNTYSAMSSKLLDITQRSHNNVPVNYSSQDVSWFQPDRSVASSGRVSDHIEPLLGSSVFCFYCSSSSCNCQRGSPVTSPPLRSRVPSKMFLEKRADWTTVPRATNIPPIELFHRRLSATNGLGVNNQLEWGGVAASDSSGSFEGSLPSWDEMADHRCSSPYFPSIHPKDDSLHNSKPPMPWFHSRLPEEDSTSALLVEVLKHIG